MNRQSTNMLVIAAVLGVFVALPVSAATMLPVPFTAQAPTADWRQPWQDACEEATIVMVDAFYSGRTLDAIRAQQDILQALHIKEGTFGPSLDEGVEKMSAWINRFYPWEARVVENPTMEQIKQEVDARRPVILPTYGRALFNPFFHDGGPDYHTIVISGYDDEAGMFITQEPGTKRGLDFRYSYDRLMSAMHDFVPGRNTVTGKRVALFTSPSITHSGTLDGDGDGLTKQDELQHGTILWLADSDGDGYTDGEEVRHGYFANLDEKRFSNGALVKTASRPEVYMLEHGKKRHIRSETIFLQRGWRWQDIHVVSDAFLSRFSEGRPVNT